MDYLFYLIDYVISCAVFGLFICWIFYLLKAIKYKKTSCESFYAEIISIKEKTRGNKYIYTYRYIVDSIAYFGEIKTKELHNIGDKVEIFFRRNNRSESITQKAHSKLVGKFIGFLIGWVICNILFVFSIYGQYLLYSM